MNDNQSLRKSANGVAAKKKSNKPHISEQIYQILEIVFVLLFWTLQTLYYVAENLYRKVYKPEPRSVKGEIVLVTGTGHGIGKHLALKYAEAGATVVGLDINKTNNDETIKEISTRYKVKAHGYVCDVADRESILEVSKKIEEEVGEVTILIANAGIMPCHLLEEHSPDEIRRIFDINVMQLFWLLEAHLPTMKKNNYGHIVAISSIAGLAGFANLIPYCASKYAVRGLIESLYEELRTDRKNKVKCTTVYPYMVDTGLCKNPRIKFNILMDLLMPEAVAEDIMLAQRRDIPELSLPGYLYTMQNITRLFPNKAAYKLIDLMDSGIDSDLIR